VSVGSGRILGQWCKGAQPGHTARKREGLRAVRVVSVVGTKEQGRTWANAKYRVLKLLFFSDCTSLLYRFVIILFLLLFKFLYLL
jgi:hypothetical protein